ncbi:hypothetical protein SAY86_024682 [Trapa natans]|uniref:Uncharacterized protein n=1 Tax=Trapa natans TaxID=22666 RepID=A0AAN7M733_TRANT|nr:hypothetical protein SAY86_024682 [Trapa natans]
MEYLFTCSDGKMRNTIHRLCLGSSPHCSSFSVDKFIISYRKFNSQVIVWAKKITDIRLSVFCFVFFCIKNQYVLYFLQVQDDAERIRGASFLFIPISVFELEVSLLQPALCFLSLFLQPAIQL